MNAQQLDYRAFHALYELKKCLLFSLEYLELNGYVKKGELTGQMAGIVSMANSLRLRALKYMKTTSCGEINRMVNLLTNIELEEKIVISLLLKILDCKDIS